MTSSTRRVARQHAVVDGVADHAVQNALGFLHRCRAVCLGHPLQKAAQALRLIRLLECEATERRCRGINVLQPSPGVVSDRPAR